jgi:hypothetical protein
MSDQEFNCLNQSLLVKISHNGQTAAAEGHDYNVLNIIPLKIKHVVIVQEGTVAGKPTVDIVLVDEAGNEYVTMLTAALLTTLPI